MERWIDGWMGAWIDEPACGCAILVTGREDRKGDPDVVGV